jgi:hypothetical protein
MAGLSAGDAVATARRELGLDDNVPGRAWPVRRLDRPGDVYYLVVFGDDNAAVAVAAVGAQSGEMRNSARVQGVRPHLTVDDARAAELAGAGAGARIELVWRPSPASRSPLYPLWLVQTGRGEVYVDQQGALWSELEPGRA